MVGTRKCLRIKSTTNESRLTSAERSGRPSFLPVGDCPETTIRFSTLPKRIVTRTAAPTLLPGVAASALKLERRVPDFLPR